MDMIGILDYGQHTVCSQSFEYLENLFRIKVSKGAGR